jgi:hypothetical protein
VADWTDELKAKVIKMYQDAKPTPENTTEVVKSIAEDLGDGFTANGVRVILVKAGEYLKKTPTTGSKGGNGEAKAPRVNKSDSINELIAIIESTGLEADQDIINKLTGKAAVYFKQVIEKSTQAEG